MSTEVAVRATTRAGRSPGRVVAALTTRKTVRSGALWGGVFGLYVAASALGYAATYKSQLARAALAQSFGSNFGFNAIIGPAHDIDTVAGFTAWRASSPPMSFSPEVGGQDHR